MAAAGAATPESASATTSLTSVTKRAKVGTREAALLRSEFSVLRELHEAGVRCIPEPVACAEEGGAEDAALALTCRLVARPLLSEITPMSTHAALCEAAQVAELLEQLHRNHIVLQHLCPGNIAVDLASDQAWLTDLSRATRASWRRDAASTRAGGKTYAWPQMSPEQTGRVNRSVDERTDLYSLGACLFEFLTGRSPFQADDPAELVHATVALVPPDMGEAVPPVVARIVARLLAKAPEDRYQTAAGARRDLELCLQAIAEDGSVGDDVPIGAGEARDRFHVVEKLYGREEQLQRLLAEHAQAADGCRFAVLSGYSGVGKSAIVYEMRQHLAPGALFAAGKFGQLARTEPYSAVVQALNGVAEALLATAPAEACRARLRRALGAAAGLVADFAPALARLIGPGTPPVEPLSGPAARARFEEAFVKCVAALCQPEAPLTLFLDDLQWADSASLALVELLVRRGVPHLLLLGAYRDNEVDESHLLAGLLAAVEPHAAVRVLPLTLADQQRLVRDSLQCGAEVAGRIADVAHQKTGGNPFFLTQMLYAMHRSGALAFAYDRGGGGGGQWVLDAEAAARIPHTDNVVDLMIAKVRDLPADALHTVQLAALIGPVFDLRTLAAVREVPPRAAFEHLQAAVREHLVACRGELHELPDGSAAFLSFRFTHDRVQQAAYESVPEAERAPSHLRMARLLSDKEAEKEKEDDEHLFALADHFNCALQLLSSAAERRRVAELNLRASLRAQSSMARAAALEYARHALRAAGDERWPALFERLIATELINGNFEASREFVEAAVRQAADPVGKAGFLMHSIVAHTVRGEYADGVRMAARALALLEVDVPGGDAAAVDAAVEQELDEALRRLERLGDVRGLVALPQMQDPKWRLVVRLLHAVGPTCYISNQRLWAFLVAKIANTCIVHGNVTGACVYAYSGVASLLCSTRHVFRHSADLAWVAVALASERESPSAKCVALLAIGGRLHHWYDSMLTAEHLLTECFAVAMETSNLQYGAYALGNRAHQRLLGGHSLRQLRSEVETGLAFAVEQRNSWATEIMRGVQISSALLSAGADDAEAHAAHLQQARARQALVIYRVIRARSLYILGRMAEAWALCRDVDADIVHIRRAGLLAGNEHIVTRALVACALPGDDHAHDVAADVRLLERWAEASPLSFAARLALVKAEAAASSDSDSENDDCWATLQLFADAARLAEAHGYGHLAAVAQERAALFSLARGLPLSFAEGNLRAAWRGFRKWGAVAAARRLERAHPGVAFDGAGEAADDDAAGTADAAAPPAAGGGHGAGADGGENNAPVEDLDVLSIVKASQAISEDMQFSGFARKLMRVLVQSAGANRGMLLLRLHEAAAWSVLVRATADAAGSGEVAVDTTEAAATPETVPMAVVDEAVASGEPVIVEAGDPAAPYQMRSALCIPLSLSSAAAAAVLLENTLVSSFFTPQRVGVVGILSQQVAISLDNSRLFSQYADMYEQLVVGLARALPSGRVLSGNPAFWRMLGVGPGAQSGGDFDLGLVLAEPSTKAGWLEALARADGALQGYEVRLRAQSGERLWVSMNTNPLRDANGAVAVLQLSLQDVTASKEKAELELQRHQARTDFLSAVSHEVRTPMNTILCMAEVGLDSFADNPAVVDAMRSIRFAGKQLLSLVNEVLDHRKAESGQLDIVPQPFFLREEVAGIMDMLAKAKQREGVALRHEVRADVPDHIVADSRRVTQCVLNLVSNALKFTDRGEVSLLVERAGPERFAEAVAPRFASPGSSDCRPAYRRLPSAEVAAAPATSTSASASSDPVLCFSVTDSGRGLTADQRAVIFEPYVQATSSTWRTHGGTGLGLSIVRQMAHAMGGRCGAESPGPGLGSTFWFTVPLEAAPEGLADVEEGGPSGPALSPEQRAAKCLLIVDDSKMNVKVARMTCKSIGFTKTLSASDGHLAVDLMEARGDEVDAVLMDLHMPTMDGAQATRELRRRGFTLPIIAVTAASSEQDKELCTEAGMDRIVLKPIQRGELEEILNEVLSSVSSSSS